VKGPTALPDNFHSPVGLRRWHHNSVVEQREGYDLSLLEDCEDAYRLTAIASAEKIPTLFNAFTRFFPGEAFFILEYYPEPDKVMTSRSSAPGNRPTPEVFYSSYIPVNEILRELAPYLERLVHDGFVAFGLANNRAGLEMFYSEEKVLTFFTDNHLRLCDFLTQNNIPHRSELSLPSDFGHDHLSLLGLPREELPKNLAELNNAELDSLNFCNQLVEQLDMYPVEEGLSFFLTRKEQTLVATIMKENHFEDLSEVEFGGLLLDWSDFVTECGNCFEGDLQEYQQALRIRDCIQFVIEAVPGEMSEKIMKIVADPDSEFQKILTDRRKRFDAPARPKLHQDRFWYHGVVRKQGTILRRDLIRNGWFGS